MRFSWVANVAAFVAVVLLCGILFIQIQTNYKHLMANKSNTGTSINSLSNTEELSPSSRKKAIIILSSVGRSGSTLVAELLKTRKNSVLFFEPDFLIENDDCFKVSNCVVEYLRNILNCSYDEKFKKWFSKKLAFLSYFHQSVADCNQYKNEAKCRAAINIRGLCHDNDFRIMKLIRVHLGYMESLLRDDELDVKIIYLIRDPRGAGNSIRKFAWDSTAQTICSNMNDDLIAFDYLKSHYPDKVTKITYEEFCLNPVQLTNHLFKFAFNDDFLSNETKLFLETHTKINKSGPLNTVRKSKEQYQKWRFEIPKQYLTKMESFKLCKTVLNKMKHTIFETIENTKNINISLFSKS